MHTGSNTCHTDLQLHKKKKKGNRSFSMNGPTGELFCFGPVATLMLPMAGFTKRGPVSPPGKTQLVMWRRCSVKNKTYWRQCICVFRVLKTIALHTERIWFFSMSTHMMVCVCRWGTKGHCEMTEHCFERKVSFFGRIERFCGLEL